ncbi:hypothetical protein K457DRAFT_151417 [Linnemannia elongata AG-77]|uniref:Nudix hydrolase domain-containing protein n=1 Tax=Linnemannia elongata AG-77 TaxID=1314771 RepID=A0A197KG17_9FUNG|nr:hypothetical protein K457DRAFT_151417 [Linnemannia elongata AG-77]
MTSSQGHRDQESSPSQPSNGHGHGNKFPTTTTTDPSDFAFDLSFLPIRKIFTLIFIHDLEHNQLLLGKKQRGPLLGQWNGFGGKVEKGLETITESAARELAEEAFMKAPLFAIGSIQWVVESNPESAVREPAYRDVMIVYKAHSLQPSAPDPSVAPTSDLVQPPKNTIAKTSCQRITEFQASDEMAPGWWDIDALPWEDMRINHKVWYPFMLADRPFRGVYWYETRTSVEEGALNAQRETVKEIWVEDLPRRCVQFGDRSLGGSGRSGEEGEEGEEGERLENYARQLGLEGRCYLAGGHDHKGEKEKRELGWPEPIINKSLDDVWLRNDIAQAEQTWLNTRFP